MNAGNILLKTFCVNNLRRRTILISVIGLICFLATFNYVNEERLRHMRIVNDCYKNPYPTEYELLRDIIEDPVPTGPKNIFFLETSCAKDANVRVTMNARQLCAVESAAKNNPEHQVHLLFVANLVLSNASDSWPMLKQLLKYPNIQLRRINISNYAENTPLDYWMQEGKVFESSYAASHLSDALRYLTLFKFGGTYLDLDVVVLKNLDLAGINYSGAEASDAVAAGVMNFAPDQFGHEVAEMCVKDLLQNYNGFDWGNNGPGVVTRVLQRICSTTNTFKMDRNRCFGFNVYPPSAFYAIPWRQHSKFFNESQTNEVMDALKDSFVAHVWNKHSHKIQLEVGSKAAYAKLAETHCPKVYSSCGKYF